MPRKCNSFWSESLYDPTYITFLFLQENSRIITSNHLMDYLLLIFCYDDADGLNYFVIFDPQKSDCWTDFDWRYVVSRFRTWAEAGSALWGLQYHNSSMSSRICFSFCMPWKFILSFVLLIWFLESRYRSVLVLELWFRGVLFLEFQFASVLFLKSWFCEASLS